MEISFWLIKPAGDEMIGLRLKVWWKFSRQGSREYFAYGFDKNILSKVRLKFENRSSIDPEIIFKRDGVRDEKNSSRVSRLG